MSWKFYFWVSLVVFTMPLEAQRDNRVRLDTQVRGVLPAANIDPAIARDSELPADTDDVPQGAVNRYFSDALARAALSAGANVSYSSVTGVVSVPSFPWGSLTSVPSAFNPDVTGAYTWSGPNVFDQGTSTLFIVRGGSAQSGSVFQIRNDANSEVFGVDEDGTTRLGGSGGNTITGLAAGGMTINGGDGAGDLLILRSTSHATPGSIRLPELINCDTIDTDTDGDLSCGTDGGGGGGSPVGSNYEESFTGQTSVVLDHAFNHAKLIVSCYDASNVEVTPDTVTIAGSTPFAVTATFSPALTGKCVVSGGGAGIHTATATTTTSLSVPAATHGLGENATLTHCYDNQATPELVQPGSVTRNGSGDLVATFAFPFTGECEVRP